jgi:hypothetical protein
MRKLAALLLTTLAASAFTLTFVWSPNAPEEEITSYQLYSATNVTGPYTLRAATTNGAQTNLVLTNIVASRSFYYLTASNLWCESLPSNTVTTPAPAKSSTSLVIRVQK